MRIRFVVGSLIALVAVAPSLGETPLGTAFTYHGQLKEGGVPLDDTADFEFSLWDDAGGGNPPLGGTQVGGVQAIDALPVTAGLFTVTLNDGGEFGGNAFIGNARWLQIAVRSPAGGGVFTTLAPRQALTATPHALLALNAAKLGGIAASEYVTTANAGNTFIENDTVQQPTANFNISGNGTVGSLNANGAVSLGGIAPPAAAPAGQGRIYFDIASNRMRISENSGAFVNLVGAGGVSGSGTVNSIPFWSAGTTLGTSQITQSANGVQLPNGVQLAAGAQGNHVALGSPNGETGMSISGATGRADVRFDGTTLRLLAGPAGGPPSNGIAITSTGVQMPNGVQLAVGAQGNAVAFGSPNSETGMTISGAGGRADLRFDGTLKLVNGPGGIPPATNGIAIDTSGNVGIGTTAPIAKLDVENSQVGKSAVFGRETGTNGVGVYGEATQPSGVGVFARNLNGTAVYADGNVSQTRGYSGLVKAMVQMHYDGTIPFFVRCYNGVTGSSSGQCGFSYDHYLSGLGNYLHTTINFGFQVNDRFISLTSFTPFQDVAVGVSIWSFPNAQTVDVRNDYDFYIIVY